MNKNDLNKNIHLSEGNIKSKNTEDIIFLTWSLRSRLHCPYSTEMCKKRCFARKNESFKTVRESRDKNFEETKKESFVEDMINILNYQLQRPKTKNKKIFVRIHTSGDFYNLEYLEKWVEITNYFKNNKKILFQAYTKSMPILKKYLENNKAKLNDINIHFVWSIWDDTPKQYTDYAKEIGMQTFTALPKERIKNEIIENKSFLCEGDCGNCRQCYTGKIDKIVIPYH